MFGVLQVRYSLDDEGGVRIDFEATTTKATTINMTNHCFFNLAGHVGAERPFVPLQSYPPTWFLCPVQFIALIFRSKGFTA